MMLTSLKKGSMSMTEFFGKLKVVANELIVTANLVGTLDFLTHLISRLGQPFYPVVVYIKANLAKMIVNEAYYVNL